MPIEPLESRIVPTVIVPVLGGGFMVKPGTGYIPVPESAVLTFTDVDGDLVTIKSNKGFDADLEATVTLIDEGVGKKIKSINFVDYAWIFAGANISVTAQPAGDGDGLVNVEEIDATGMHLGSVSVKGDLTRIFAGDEHITGNAIQSLSVKSIGRFGASNGGYVEVSVEGGLGSLRVANDVVDARISTWKLGSASIGGSLLTSGADQDCDIFGGKLGKLVIRGNVDRAAIHSTSLSSLVIHGSLTNGWVTSNAAIGSLRIDGNVRDSELYAAGSVRSLSVGQSFVDSRLLSETKIGSVKVGGNFDGEVQCADSLTSLIVGGSLLGRPNDSREEVFCGGSIKALKVRGNFVDGYVLLTDGTISSLSIGGSMMGGEITCAGPGTSVVTVRGNIENGFISAGGIFRSVSIGGSIMSGGIGSDSIGKISIAGDIDGGDVSAGTIGSMIVGGSIVGGKKDYSGTVYCSGFIGSLRIHGNIEGSSVGTAITRHDTGAIIAGSIGSLVIDGSILAGTATNRGSLANSGAVRVANDIGSITVKGSLIGSSSNPVLITARGQLVPGTTTDIAIKSITVGGSVEFADILAGYDTSDIPAGVNPDAQIGSVIVGSNWIASNLIAGVQDDATPLRNASFGDNDDTKITTGTDSPDRISRIARIVIKDQVFSTAIDTDHFGIAAQHIGSLKIGGTPIALTAGEANDLAGIALSTTDDLRVRETAL